MNKRIVPFVALTIVMPGVGLAESGMSSGAGVAEPVEGVFMPILPEADPFEYPESEGPGLSAMPDSDDPGDPKFEGSTEVVHYDVETGVVTRINGPIAPSASGLLRTGPEGFEGHAPMGHHGDGEIVGDYRLFNNMVQVVVEEDIPWRRNCKLEMWFTDVNGVQRKFSGSGTLVDAQTVITAGHCLYMRTNNNITYNAFADYVRVIPSYADVDLDGVGDDFYYGDSWSKSLMVYTSWSQGGNFDGDVGIVNLRRPVGSMVGWHPLAAGGTCSSIIANYQFHNASYPAESCPGGVLHTGNQMYYWNGTFDTCVGANQFRVLTGGGNCLDTVWGGMSGSSAYYMEDDNRYILGICSNSDRQWRGQYVHIQDFMMDDCYDDMIPAGRGTDFDPHALYARSSASQLAVGDVIPNFVFTVSNPCNASATEDWSFTVWLSEDDQIDAGDRPIQSFTIENAVIDEMMNYDVAMYCLIPTDLASGTYYVGVTMESDADTDSSNNTTQGWDTLELVIDGVTTLDMTDFAVTPAGEVLDGSSITADWVLENVGGDNTGSNIWVDYYASDGPTISYTDIYLGTTVYSDLDGGAVLNGSDVLTLPAGLAGELSSEIWIGAIASSSGDDTVGVVDDPITVFVRPANDDCSNAIPVTSGSLDFTTRYATTDGNAHPECDTEGDGGVTVNDIWFLWTAECTGIGTISTCDSVDYDSDLVAYTWFGDCGTRELLGCNDDGVGCDNYTSELTIPVSAGEQYLVRVGGWNGTISGSGSLSLECTPVYSPTDLDQDGDTDVDDLLRLLSAYGVSDEGDVNGDGLTDVDDLLALLAEFGS
ncbi:MAG: hypothetical protein MK116_04500 [Phycisphaerales bacterium]|nr:hypothetical protein [Phycisphaerales bacterium]